jgi:hypothetical protein
MIKLFDFPDTLKDAAQYDRLGFIVDIDDPANGIFSAEYSPKGKTDAMGVLSLLDDCVYYDLQPSMEINNVLYTFDEGWSIIDNMATSDTYVNGVGTIL